MKKVILLLLSILAFNMTTNAQAVKTKALNSSQWYFGDDSNYSLAITGDSVLTYTVTLNKPDDVLYDIQVVLDSVSGTPDYDIDVKYKVFADDSWSDAETDVTWDGTSSDTTILFQEHSTALFARYIQLQINGQAGTGAATVNKVEFKLWP